MASQELNNDEIETLSEAMAQAVERYTDYQIRCWFAPMPKMGFVFECQYCGKVGEYDECGCRRKNFVPLVYRGFYSYQ